MTACAGISRSAARASRSNSKRGDPSISGSYGSGWSTAAIKSRRRIFRRHAANIRFASRTVSSGEHRGEALTFHHFARRTHRMGKRVERLAKCFELGRLSLTQRGVVVAATDGVLAIALAPGVEGLKRVADRTIHRQVGHERPVTMGAMENHARLKMAVRELE